MGCAPTRIWRPSTLDRGVWHVSINADTSYETQQGSPGRYAGIFGGLLTTKPSYLSKPSPESDLKSNRKPEKAEWTEYLGWLMWCNGYISYEPSYKNNVAVQI